MITPKQAKALQFIESYIANHGHAPALSEIRDAMGIKSTSGAHRFVTLLERHGMIRRRAGQARALELTSTSTTNGADRAAQIRLELQRDRLIEALKKTPCYGCSVRFGDNTPAALRAARGCVNCRDQRALLSEVHP